MPSTELPPFESVFDEYKNKIFGLIVRFIRNQEDAEDLTQQVFIRAYKKYDSFRQESDVYTWLYRIAMNLCVDYIRGRKREIETVPVEVNADDSHRSYWENIPDGELSHQNRLEQKELMGLIQETIADMKEKYRHVIILREFEGLSYEEIAKTLGISVKVVEIRLYRARNKLKKKTKDFL